MLDAPSTALGQPYVEHDHETLGHLRGGEKTKTHDEHIMQDEEPHHRCQTDGCNEQLHTLAFNDRMGQSFPRLGVKDHWVIQVKVAKMQQAIIVSWR